MSVVPLSRANNVSIMLTQFSQFKQGSDIAQGIRRAVVTGKGLSLERLSLLLQVVCNSLIGPKLPSISVSTAFAHLKVWHSPRKRKHAFSHLTACTARLFGGTLVFSDFEVHRTCL